MTAEHLLVKGAADSELVETDAQLVQDVPRSAQPGCFCRMETFCLLPGSKNPGPGIQFPNWKAGSLLRLKGVCSIQGDEAHEPQAFKILIARTTTFAAKSPALVGSAANSDTRRRVDNRNRRSVSWIILLRRQVRLQNRRASTKPEGALADFPQAGMAEVATSVLHNVGNVLNSINVSATLVTDCVRESRLSSLTRLVKLFRQQAAKSRGVPD